MWNMKQKRSPFTAKQPSNQACPAHFNNALSRDQTASEKKDLSTGRCALAKTKQKQENYYQYS